MLVMLLMWLNELGRGQYCVYEKAMEKLARVGAAQELGWMDRSGGQGFRGARRSWQSTWCV